MEYFNNRVICDLVEQSHKGIIAILDEACLNVGKVTDQASVYIPQPRAAIELSACALKLKQFLLNVLN